MPLVRWISYRKEQGKQMKTKTSLGMKVLGKHVTRNSTEEISYSAELNEATGEITLTGECPEYDIDGEDFFVTNTGREYKICPVCFSHIMINDVCMGKKTNRCKFGIQLMDI